MLGGIDVGLNPAHFGPNLADVGPLPVNMCRTRAKFGRFWPNSGERFQNSGSIWATPDQFIFAAFGNGSVECGPALADLWPKRDDVVRICPTFWRLWPEFSQLRPTRQPQVGAWVAERCLAVGGHDVRHYLCCPVVWEQPRKNALFSGCMADAPWRFAARSPRDS